MADTVTLDSQALTTVANLRGYLARERTDATTGRLSSDDLTPLINRVSAAIADYLGYNPICPADEDDFLLDGDGTEVIRLYTVAATPIVEIDELTLLGSGQTVTARTDVHGIGYTVNGWAGIITLHGYTTDPGIQTVLVSARCGYDATTAALATAIGRQHRRALNQLEAACLQWAALLFTDPIPSTSSVTDNGGTITVFDTAIPKRVAHLLDPYRRLVVG